MPEEQTFYSQRNVLITSTRAVFDKTTFAVANITSVKTERQPATLLIFGAATVICLFFSCMIITGLTITNTFIYFILLALSIGGGLFVQSKQKDTYHLEVSTSGVEKKVLSSTDQRFIEAVEAALNMAIISRG